MKELEMVAITPTTRERIKGFLESFIENIVREYKGRKMPTFESPSQFLSQRSTKAQLKPFHYAIIPEELMRISEFERGFSTSLGNSFEECARLIALDHHEEAHRGYPLTGEVSTSAINELEHQVSQFDHSAKKSVPRPSFDQMIHSVLDRRRNDDLIELTTKADLHILTRDASELYFEMKGPKPNKGQCIEVTQRLLRFHLLRGKARPAAQAYYAMPYNPYGPSRLDYRYGIALRYTPFEEAVLVGPEFWDIVGGPTTLEELLGIYREVGSEKGKYMIDALAFGF
jgi:hypothetical protein